MTKSRRALVIHVRRLQHPQSANKLAAATDENRETFWLLRYAAMALLRELGSIPFAGALDLGVRPNPGDFQLHLPEVDRRHDIFGVGRPGEKRQCKYGHVKCRCHGS